MRRFVERKHQSPLYKGTVESIIKLTASEGLDKASRAYAEAVSEEVKNGLISKGFKRSEGKISIERLLGKRPKAGMSVRPPGTDHATLWLKDGQPALFLSQPYHLSFEELKDIVSFCEKYGLEARIETWPDFHFPGSVLCLWYERKKQRQQSDSPILTINN